MKQENYFPSASLKSTTARTGLLVILLSLIIFPGCSPMTSPRNDPLIGKIVSSDNLQTITYQQLLAEMANADVIYLGENHDNEAHHRHQLQVIQDLVKLGKRPSLGFEFFSTDQTGYLMSYVTRQKSPHSTSIHPKITAQLRKKLGWQDRTDVTWQFYFQFIEFARKNGLTVFGADLPAGIVRRITRNGIDGITEIEKGFLKPTGYQGEAYRQLMFDKFKASHCGFAPQKLMENMYGTWLARNDTMAHSVVKMINADPQQPVVVILGKGHVEHNMAVYERVNHLKSELNQLNLGFTEIRIEPTQLKDYFPLIKRGDTTFPPAHEFVWFTQRTSYEDPCQKFRQQLKRMKEMHQKSKRQPHGKQQE